MSGSGARLGGYWATEGSETSKPDERALNLEAMRMAADDLWRARQSMHVPLAVAAAITFHQVHGNTKAIAGRTDYDDALNIAASAISRLIPVYELSDPREGRKPLAIDLVKARFVRGATELRSLDGQAIRGLTVLRSEFASALSLIKRTGLPYSFAAMPAEQPADAEARVEGKEKRPLQD